MHEPDHLHWKPATVPRPVTLTGRTVMLEPLDAEKHAAALWQAVQGHDEVWAYLADGPYASESELRRALAEKQSGSSAQFFALITKAKWLREGLRQLHAHRTRSRRH